MMIFATWSTYVGPLGGVLLGFLLGAAANWIREKWRLKRLREALRAECKTLLCQIPDKKDIVVQSVRALRERDLLCGSHVRCATMVYRTVLPDLLLKLSDEERDVLHYAYEHLRVADEEVEQQERSVEMLKRQGMTEPHAALANHLEALLGAYDLAHRLLQSFLNGSPVDVARREQRLKNIK